VKSLLKEADLDNLTMKSVCNDVYENYPGLDLTSKKDFIKATVKKIIA
jgi:protein DEK